MITYYVYYVMVRKKINIFDNHKIPRKYRKYSDKFTCDTSYSVQMGFEYGSSNCYSKNDKIGIIVLGKNAGFTVYLKSKLYSLTSLKSTLAVNN